MRRRTVLSIHTSIVAGTRLRKPHVMLLLVRSHHVCIVAQLMRGFIREECATHLLNLCLPWVTRALPLFLLIVSHSFSHTPSRTPEPSPQSDANKRRGSPSCTVSAPHHARTEASHVSMKRELISSSTCARWLAVSPSSISLNSTARTSIGGFRPSLFARFQRLSLAIPIQG